MLPQLPHSLSESRLFSNTYLFDRQPSNDIANRIHPLSGNGSVQLLDRFVASLKRRVRHLYKLCRDRDISLNNEREVRY